MGYAETVRKLAVFSAVAIAGIIAACVGSDPAPVTIISDDAGSPASDASSTTDAPASNADASDSSSSADAGTEAATPPLDVRTYPGLRLWLESSMNLQKEMSGIGIASWRDSSGRWDGGTSAGAPDGGYHVAVPYQPNPPIVSTNGINGRPSVVFTDGNGWLSIENHDDFQFGTGDFLVVEVAKITSGSGPLWVLRPQASAGFEESFFPGLLCVSFGGSATNGCTSPAYVPSSGPHVFAARRKGDVFDLRVDATVKGTVDRTGVPTNIVINGFAQANAFIGGGITMDVSELIVIVGPTSDASLADLEGALKKKYGTP